MTSILELVTNDFARDPRVHKTSIALARAGYDVSVLCYRENDTRPSIETVDIGIQVYRTTKNAVIPASLERLLKRVYYQSKSTPNVSNSSPTPSCGQVLKTSAMIYGYVLQNNFMMARTAHAHGLRADIYHANDLDTLVAAFYLAKLYGGKVIYDAHELYTEQWGDFNSIVRWKMAEMEKFLIRRCSGVMTVNNSIAAELATRYGLITTPTVVMNCPPFVHAPITHPPSAHPRVIYVGSYSPDRGLENLISGFRYVDDATLSFMGWGPLRDKMVYLTNQYGLTDKVSFLEPVPMPRIVESLYSFDIGVVPYLPTSLNNLYATPNKLFEYLHAGLAVAGSDIPEVRRVVKDKGTGRLFNPYHPTDIGHVINEMVHDNLESYKLHSYKWAVEEYNWERQSERMLKLYENVI